MLKTLDILETGPDIKKKLKRAESEINAGKYEVWRGKARMRANPRHEHN